GKLLQVLPPGPDVIYALKQDDSAVNFAYTDLLPENSKDYLLKLDNTGALDNAPALGRAIVEQVTRAGVPLDNAWLNRIGSGKGVILLEGRAATKKPLVLE